MTLANQIDQSRVLKRGITFSTMPDLTEICIRPLLQALVSAHLGFSMIPPAPRFYVLQKWGLRTWKGAVCTNPLKSGGSRARIISNLWIINRGSGMWEARLGVKGGPLLLWILPLIWCLTPCLSFPSRGQVPPGAALLLSSAKS